MICMRFSTLSASSDSHGPWGISNILSQPFSYHFKWRFSQQVLLKIDIYSRQIKQICIFVLVSHFKHLGTAAWLFLCSHCLAPTLLSVLPMLSPPTCIIKMMFHHRKTPEMQWASESGLFFNSLRLSEVSFCVSQLFQDIVSQIFPPVLRSASKQHISGGREHSSPVQSIPSPEFYSCLHCKRRETSSIGELLLIIHLLFICQGPAFTAHRSMLFTE